VLGNCVRAGSQQWKCHGDGLVRSLMISEVFATGSNAEDG